MALDTFECGVLLLVAGVISNETVIKRCNRAGYRPKCKINHYSVPVGCATPVHWPLSVPLLFIFALLRPGPLFGRRLPRREQQHQLGRSLIKIYVATRFPRRGRRASTTLSWAGLRGYFALSLGAPLLAISCMSRGIAQFNKRNTRRDDAICL